MDGALPHPQMRPLQEPRAHAGETGGRRWLGILAIVVAVGEIALCFAGPLAFTRRPSLVLFAPFSANLTRDEVSKVAELVERQIALTGSFSIVSRRFVEEHFARTDPDFDRSILEPADSAQAQELARKLELERYAIASVYKTDMRCELYVAIRDTSSGDNLREGRFSSGSVESLLEGIDKERKPLDFRGSLSVEAKGIGLTDTLILALLVLELLLGLLAVLGRRLGLLLEAILGAALILFVFAFIFALSANMSYVQRYIASSGQLRLARSTAVEQVHALLRFGPLLLLDAGWYAWKALARRAAGRARCGPALLDRFVGTWALPWVVLSAALFAFSFPSAVSLDGLGGFAWLSLVPLFLVLLAARPAAAVFYGVLFGTLQALIVNYWHGTYDYVTLHLITIAFVVEYALFMVPLVAVIRASGRWGFLTAPLAWVVFDWGRSVGILGYPWGLIGTTQYRVLPLIQIASIGGVWAVDFVVLLVNAALAWAIAAPALGWSWGERRGGRPLLRYALPPAIAAATVAVCLLGGAAILGELRTRLYGSPGTPKATVLLLQQNTDPRKHEYRENTEKLMSLTNEALRGLTALPDLIVWPEGGFALGIREWTDPRYADSYWGSHVRDFLDYQKGLGTWLVTGTEDCEIETLEDGETIRRDYNSSVLLGPGGSSRAFYHKMHLVPFSEYFPLDPKRFPGLRELFQKYDISNWDVGRERIVYVHDKMRFFTPLCFEDVFSDDLRRFVLQGVDLIVNMSNDYWSLSPVEGRQHGILALFRAVENQRPILRSTCSGYTVSVDATGQIQPGSPEAYKEGSVVTDVPLPERRLTLYTRWGDWFPLLCSVSLLAFALAKGVLLALGASGNRDRVVPRSPASP